MRPLPDVPSDPALDEPRLELVADEPEAEEAETETEAEAEVAAEDDDELGMIREHATHVRSSAMSTGRRVSAD